MGKVQIALVHVFYKIEAWVYQIKMMLWETAQYAFDDAEWHHFLG
jgi:hypothetical protein